MLRRKHSAVRRPKKQRRYQANNTKDILEELFSSVHVGFAYLDQEFNFIRVNKAYAHAYACEPTTFSGKNYFDLFPNPEAYPIFQKVLESGQSHHAYARVLDLPAGTDASQNPPGTQSYWDWSVLPVHQDGLALVLTNVTAREMEHRAFRQSQEMFKHLFEAAADASILVNQGGTIIAFNQQAERLFGYQRAEITGKPIEILVPHAYRNVHQRHREMYIADPHPSTPESEGMPNAAFRLELPVQRKDGSLFASEITLNPFKTGSELMVLSVIRDISLREHPDLELINQTELVRLLQDVAIAANEANSIQSAFQFTLNRLCQHLNWAFGHAFLVNDDTITSTTIWTQDIPERFSAFRAISESLKYRQGEGLPGEAFVSGRPAWMTNLAENLDFLRRPQAAEAGLNTGMAIPVMAGRTVVGVLEFFHEEIIPEDPNLMAVLPHIGLQLGRVVERKRSEQALRQTAAQLRMVMNNLPVILWVLDQQGNIILLEGKGVLAAGLPVKELTGTNFFERFHDRIDLIEQIKLAFSGVEIHTELVSNNGVTFETFLTPITNSNNTVAGIIGLSFDVTERKRMEVELEEMKHRLLDSIENERARLAKKLHDGPLQDLYGVFYQIQEVQNSLDEPGQEVARRALQTIQQVNATLRVICGELQPTTLVHLGLTKAIRSHAEMLQERAEEIIIHLDMEDDNLSTVGAGREANKSELTHQLRLGLFRAYQQIISNAIDHAEANHIWVRLRLNSDEIVLEVQDNGKGFQVPKYWIELVREGRVGLVSTLERVQGLNGKMEIHSTQQGGTLVRILIPR
jgi:PAS domain S-box-containing protein